MDVALILLTSEDYKAKVIEKKSIPYYNISISSAFYKRKNT